MCCILLLTALLFVTAMWFSHLQSPITAVIRGSFIFAVCWMTEQWLMRVQSNFHEQLQDEVWWSNSVHLSTHMICWYDLKWQYCQSSKIEITICLHLCVCVCVCALFETMYHGDFALSIINWLTDWLFNLSNSGPLCCYTFTNCKNNGTILGGKTHLQ